MQEYVFESQKFMAQKYYSEQSEWLLNFVPFRYRSQTVNKY